VRFLDIRLSVLPYDSEVMCGGLLVHDFKLENSIIARRSCRRGLFLLLRGALGVAGAVTGRDQVWRMNWGGMMVSRSFWLVADGEAPGFGVGQAEGNGNPSDIGTALVFVSMRDDGAPVLARQVVPGVQDDGDVEELAALFLVADLRVVSRSFILGLL